MATIDWDAIPEFLDRPETGASSSEIAILRLAGSLAGGRTRLSLLEMTGGLDENNSRLLLEALAHRFGWHERGTTATITGHPGARPRVDPASGGPR